MFFRSKLREASWSAAREADVRLLCRFGILLVCVCTTQAVARDVYVSITGSDKNDGSETQPFRTIQKSANQSQPGDTIHIAPGLYEEHVKITTSGKPNQPITFKADPGTRNKGFVLQASHITIDGFDIGFGPVAQHDAAIRVLPTAHETWIINNHIHHLTNSYGIDLESGGKRPEDGPANCVISNNFFEYIGHINVNLFGSNNLVIGNAFANSFLEGDAIRAWGANHRIACNIMTNMGKGSKTLTRGHPDFVQTFGNWGVASHNIIFERNYCADSASQICMLTSDGVPEIRDWTFRNNIYVRVDMAANCDIPGVWWYNNLFYRCTTNTAFVIRFAPLGNKAGTASRSGARNNIFLECGSKPTTKSYGWYAAPKDLTDLDCDYNYVAGTGFSSKQVSAQKDTFHWSETHGVNGGDPGFFSITSGDFHLKPDSILAHCGSPIASFSNDFSDHPRGTNWSIGPYEVTVP